MPAGGGGQTGELPVANICRKLWLLRMLSIVPRSALESRVAGGKSTHLPFMQAPFAGASGQGGRGGVQALESNCAHKPRFTKSMAVVTVAVPRVDTIALRQPLVQLAVLNWITQSSSEL